MSPAPEARANGTVQRRERGSARRAAAGGRRPRRRRRAARGLPRAAGPAEPVAFGTSGHRGTSLDGTFTEAHVLAISEAVCRYRAEQGIDGPLFLGRDTHALSEPAFRTIVEVLAGHGVDVVVDAGDGATPTPVISHAILTHNRGGGRGTGRRDRRHALAQPARRRRLQVQPAARRARPTPTSPAGSSARRTGCSRRGSTASARPFGEAASPARLRDRLRRRPRRGDRPRRDPRAGLRLGVDPLGGASVAVLGGDRRARTGSTSRSSTTRSTRRSASCRSTGTARSGWTARRRTRWRG